MIFLQEIQNLKFFFSFFYSFFFFFFFFEAGGGKWVGASGRLE